MSVQETESRMTLAEFIKSAGVTMTATPIDNNPNMTSDRDHARMDHWACKLRAGRSQMTVPYSKGEGHHGAAPTVDEVLDCLASDSTAVDGGVSFADFCGEFGYDTDSRKAERTYRACQRQAASLRRLLGDSAYDTLLWHTERQ